MQGGQVRCLIYVCSVFNLDWCILFWLTFICTTADCDGLESCKVARVRWVRQVCDVFLPLVHVPLG